MAVKDGLITVDAPIDVHLDDHEMAYVMDSLGIDELPGVLDWRPQYCHDDERRALFELALPELRTRGVVGDTGFVDPSVAQSFRTLSRSTWDLEIRTVTRSQRVPVVDRRCLSAGAHGQVVADRTPTGYHLRTYDGSAVVNPAAPLRFTGVSAPRETMAVALDRPRPSTWIAMGCDDSTTSVLGEALSTLTSHVEIVLVGHRGVVPERIGAPIALYDTPRGRILATTSHASDDTAWTALAPGTDTRVRSEIQTLIELCRA
jgi:hypothetical protein